MHLEYLMTPAGYWQDLELQLTRWILL